MIFSVGVTEIVNTVILGRLKAIVGNEDRARRAERNIAFAGEKSPGAHRRRGIVACSGNYGNRWDAQLVCDFRKNISNDLIALKKLGHLLLGQAAKLKHLFRPLFIFHVKE